MSFTGDLCDPGGYHQPGEFLRQVPSRPSSEKSSPIAERGTARLSREAWGERIKPTSLPPCVDTEKELPGSENPGVSTGETPELEGDQHREF